MNKGNYITPAPDRALYINLTRDYCYDVIGYDSEFPRVYYDQILTCDKSVLYHFPGNMTKDSYFDDLLAEAREFNIEFTPIDIYMIAYEVIKDCFIYGGVKNERI